MRVHGKTGKSGMAADEHALEVVILAHSEGEMGWLLVKGGWGGGG